MDFENVIYNAKIIDVEWIYLTEENNALICWKAPLGQEHYIKRDEVRILWWEQKYRKNEAIEKAVRTVEARKAELEAQSG